MNWVQYLEDNCQIRDAQDTESIRKVVDLAALSLQFKYGWYSYTVLCSSTTVHFLYTTDDGLFSAMIPIEKIIKGIVVKPILEDVVRMHSENIHFYRKK